MDRERLGDEIEDRLARVERLVGILEHHLHARPDRAQCPSRERRDVGAAEHDPAAARFLQAEDRPRDGGLPAARLSDEREHLPRSDVEGDAVDRAHGIRPPASRLVGDVEVLDVQDRFLPGALGGRGSATRLDHRGLPAGAGRRMSRSVPTR